MGTLDATARLPRGGRDDIWLKGNFSRPTQLSIDGRVVGRVAYESGGDGNYATPLRADIAAGRRRLTVRRLGASWRPGDGAAASISRIVFAPRGRARTIDVDPRRWRSACKRRVDWVEAVRDTPTG